MLSRIVYQQYITRKVLIFFYFDDLAYFEILPRFDHETYTTKTLDLSIVFYTFFMNFVPGFSFTWCH